ncbi:hypothetical protein KO533_11700 [Shewanella sp. NKUCC05_KAH]|jgi:hypothetical protein|uniref:hypothetical protein n=1 Tax=Shewanella sp. NKUCC05_KAH TaxID=2842126 RepID=UPI001C5AC478|nr:hypothetical protein [Shewanella sp. NKUCC05_KAH]MBW3527224.1 hypothetical protein [Shewanella sp. NKUCC05_KAH]
MINIHLENAIREFTSACYLSRQDIGGDSNQTKIACLIDVLGRGGRCNLGAMTGLQTDELLPIIKDELIKIGLVVQRKNDLENIRLGRTLKYENCKAAK